MGQDEIRRVHLVAQFLGHPVGSVRVQRRPSISTIPYLQIADHNAVAVASSYAFNAVAVASLYAFHAVAVASSYAY